MENYEFLGWYTDETLSTPVEFPMTITGEHTLYASFRKTVVSVSYEAIVKPEDSSVSVSNMPESEDVNPGTELVEPADPSAAGYEFVAWYTDKDCTKPAEWPMTASEDIKLYALFLVSEITEQGSGDTDVVYTLDISDLEDIHYVVKTKIDDEGDKIEILSTMNGYPVDVDYPAFFQVNFNGSECIVNARNIKTTILPGGAYAGAFDVAKLYTEDNVTGKFIVNAETIEGYAFRSTIFGYQTENSDIEVSITADNIMDSGFNDVDFGNQVVNSKYRLSIDAGTVGVSGMKIDTLYQSKNCDVYLYIKADHLSNNAFRNAAFFDKYDGTIEHTGEDYNLLIEVEMDETSSIVQENDYDAEYGVFTNATFFNQNSLSSASEPRSMKIAINRAAIGTGQFKESGTFDQADFFYRCKGTKTAPFVIQADIEFKVSEGYSFHDVAFFQQADYVEDSLVKVVYYDQNKNNEFDGSVLGQSTKSNDVDADVYAYGNTRIYTTDVDDEEKVSFSYRELSDLE